MRRFASLASGLFACVAGCGDDGGARKLPDAPVLDDAPPPDMLAAGTVNITTMSRCCTVAPNTPQPGILVVAVDADGTVAGTATTDADGKASLSIKEGATVTAIYPEDNEHDTDVHTYVGVKPDDNLTFGDGYYAVNTLVPEGSNGSMTINWTAQTGATGYQIHTPCQTYGSTDAATLTYSATLAYYCQTPTAPIVVAAVDANGKVISSAYVPAAAFTVNAIVDIAANQWVAQTADNFVLSMSGIDAVVTDARLRANADFDRYILSNSESLTPENGAASATFSLPGTAPHLYAEARLRRNGNYGAQTYYKGSPSPYAFDAPKLPWISDRAIINPAQNRVLWFETAGTYDAAVLFLQWQRNESKTSHYFNWTVILPPNVADFTLGTPPAELAAFLPSPKDFVDADLQLVDLSSAASYDAARALPEWRITSAFSAVVTGDEPAAGITSDDGGEGFTFAH